MYTSLRKCFVLHSEGIGQYESCGGDCFQCVSCGGASRVCRLEGFVVWTSMYILFPLGSIEIEKPRCIALHVHAELETTLIKFPFSVTPYLYFNRCCYQRKPSRKSLECKPKTCHWMRISITGQLEQQSYNRKPEKKWPNSSLHRTPHLLFYNPFPGV